MIADGGVASTANSSVTLAADGFDARSVAPPAAKVSTYVPSVAVTVERSSEKSLADDVRFNPLMSTVVASRVNEKSPISTPVTSSSNDSVTIPAFVLAGGSGTTSREVSRGRSLVDNKGVKRIRRDPNIEQILNTGARRDER